MSDNYLHEPDNSITDAINNAEEVLEPFEELLQRMASDPAAPFEPEMLVELVALRKDDRAAFEKLRAQLKKAGCRVTALDEVIAAEGGDTGRRGPTQADVLIDLAQAVELFHAADTTGYADLDINGHRETWPIRSKGFRRWLAHRFYEATLGAPSPEALQSALNVIEAKAQFDSPERIVHVRVGELNGKLYLDMTDETWRAVEIDINGWRVISNPPVRFRRAAGMKPLPVPIKGGSIETLRSFLNVKSDADFVLVIAWTLAVLRNRGPYPMLALSGEQGSAKSTFSSILRSLLDPNTAPLRALPREDRDLFIAANNAHILAFDNVSSLSPWISDTLCRLATGGGFAVRQLYSDQDEVLFDAARPMILNGIEEIVTRPDLADRALFLTLEPISEERRRPEAELWAQFQTEHPRILGVLLDAIVEGIKSLPETHLEKLPRMADFALWATACETTFWKAGTFWSAYCSNRDDAVESVIDADPIAIAIRGLVTPHSGWTGTASDLLAILGTKVSEAETKSRIWPKSAGVLAGRLRRVAAFLRKTGIEIDFNRANHITRRRMIAITYIRPKPEKEGALSSTPSKVHEELRPNNELVSVPTGTVARTGDGSNQDGTLKVHNNLWERNAAYGMDDMDANISPKSGPEKMCIVGWSGRL